MRQQPEAQPTSMIRSLTGMISPGKVALQVVFWVLGLGLLGWIIFRAVQTGDWGKLSAANPWLIVALLGSTVVSSILNGTTFWITIQSVRPVRWRHMQLLNLVGNMLNYAPVRLGAIARVVYHHRVDRLGLLQIGAWFAMIAYILALGVASCIVATLLYDGFDFLWVMLVVAQMALGGLATQFVAGHSLIVKHGRGIDRMVADHRAMWGALLLRILDIGAFAARMAAALYILEIYLPLNHIVVLAVVALAASLIPFGRVGFREFCVAIAAARLGSAAEVDLPWEQLALIESAGEALVYIPGGLIAMVWFRKRFKTASAE